MLAVQFRKGLNEISNINRFFIIKYRGAYADKIIVRYIINIYFVQRFNIACAACLHNADVNALCNTQGIAGLREIDYQ